MWQYHGSERPAFAQAPRAGQESVWDYPRPPRLVTDDRLITIDWQGVRLVETRTALRVLETASPPTFYFPPAAVSPGLLFPDEGSSYCEWKGRADYWKLCRGTHILRRVAWSYPTPTADFAAIAGWLAFYPQNLDCRVDGQRVQPQGGGFYGGWVTPEIIGPWKGGPGSGGW